MKAYRLATTTNPVRGKRVDRLPVLAAVLLAASPAAAAPLDPQACTTLKSEYQSLVAAGAKSDKEKGPQWAKSNLQPDRLGAIERLITVEEQLSFRCGEVLTARPALKEQPKPPQVLNADATAAGTGSNKAGAGKISSIPPPVRKNKNAGADAPKAP
ncbi:hypothetical protein [Hyphomicrobium sp. LHD-15]|uniref:hypothetical protein n=1 Tax=Hyphomicrobium sp. LHD-15 TaxID=3072142 RepID=UPI0028105CC0|nr:hypothetical protein [Hyphomicrobium sp. LHD-15]MDQ8700746.1 hypothetical protein [Hyphomicrobium sp. LHD-15]